MNRRGETSYGGADYSEHFDELNRPRHYRRPPIQRPEFRTLHYLICLLIVVKQNQSENIISIQSTNI